MCCLQTQVVGFESENRKCHHLRVYVWDFINVRRYVCRMIWILLSAQVVKSESISRKWLSNTRGSCEYLQMCECWIIRMVEIENSLESRTSLALCEQHSLLFCEFCVRVQICKWKMIDVFSSGCWVFRFRKNNQKIFFLK